MDKRYEEALERAKMILCNLPEGSSSARDIETIFPELAESEYERIRKNICRIVKEHMRHCAMAGIETGNHREALQYLEKQKERESAKCSDCKEYDLGFERGREEGVTVGYNKAMKEMEQKEQQHAEWSEEDEKNWGQIFACIKDDALKEWLEKQKARIVSDIKPIRHQPDNNLRWRRATEGANLPESIILPDGDDPRFGKCAVKDSYYIPIEELKNLPKDES